MRGAVVLHNPDGAVTASHVVADITNEKDWRDAEKWLRQGGLMGRRPLRLVAPDSAVMRVVTTLHVLADEGWTPFAPPPKADAPQSLFDEAAS